MNNYLNELKQNKTTQQYAKNSEAVPLSNFEIEDFKIPNSKVIIYENLGKYKSLEQLFGDKELIFLLYQPLDKSLGHWVLIYKNENEFQYFDSYGYEVDYPITGWYKDGQPKYLSNLLDNSILDITHNAFKFQKKSGDIATCGRHCALRARTIEEYQMPLETYIDLMVSIKQKTKRSFDNIVSDLINSKNII